MKIRSFLPAILPFLLFGCSTSGITKIEATNDLIGKICSSQPDPSQPKIDLYMTETGDWKHGSVRCTPPKGVSPDDVVIPFEPVAAAPTGKPLAILLLSHKSGTAHPFPYDLAGVLTKLEGGRQVKFVRDDPATPGVQYTAYVY